MKILIPNNNINERKYILDIIFSEFLGLEIDVVSDENCKNWEISLNNGSKLIFNDAFFSKFKDNLSYLDEKNIPQKVEFVANKFAPESDMPVIFGNGRLEVSEKEIFCGIDIFASSFFMLTRWEEYVNKTRDKHERFPAIASLAYKFKFLDRPIVNEYVQMLKNMLLALDSNIKFKKREFKLFLTHDVDILLLSKLGAIKLFRSFLGDIIKRRNLRKAFSFLKTCILSFCFKKLDPYNTFDYLMDMSEKNGTKSYFFFMGKGQSKIYDNRYSTKDKFLKNVIENIKTRGHFIGIHPTYYAYNDNMQFKKEKAELEQNLQTNISCGREHYLRFEVPTTWQIWEDSLMLWDSTLSYADKEGFRCGVCYEFSVFNILTRKKLNLKELPLIVMEGSFVTYQPNITLTQMENKILYLINKVKKYNGNFVLLWHNSSFNTSIYHKYTPVYLHILELEKKF